MTLMARMAALLMTKLTALTTIQKSLMLGLTAYFLAIHKFQIQYY
jgi:hypothetical protein